jgi:hypothetical protein
MEAAPTSQQLSAVAAAAAAFMAGQNSANINDQNNNQNSLMMNQQVDSIEANKGYTFEEQFKQLYEISDDSKRKEFLDELFQFMADRNQPVNRIPIMAKQVLDLYELYNLVVERGGLVEVINKKIWREITKGLNLPSSITSAAFTLRTQYMKYLYPYECAKKNFSTQEELQQAIDGNRRDGRRSGAAGLANYNYLIGEGGMNGLAGVRGEAYSSSPSPNRHLFAPGPNQNPRHIHHSHHHDQHQQQQQQHQHQQQLLNHNVHLTGLHGQLQNQNNSNGPTGGNSQQVAAAAAAAAAAVQLQLHHHAAANHNLMAAAVMAATEQRAQSVGSSNTSASPNHNPNSNHQRHQPRQHLYQGE